MDAASARAVRLETSTDLRNWQPLYTNSEPRPILFIDLTPSNQPCRFFRAVPWP
jgi:hypothetical protein